ncbi:hypothetical protein BDF19DRAFT_429425 [Syncephalis fuscata]|nr:hypothetical protein BDF19DRAFT_429425 [Syncephalis fuscata]
METDNNVALERLSDLMLKGWIMTNDTCFAATHTAPRMRLKGRTENWCVICDEAKIISNGGLLKPLTKETENTKDAQPINVKEATQPLSRARRDDISRLLGEKMLQGWTLMEMACSMDGCVGVPLMKDTSGQLHCVSCYNITNKIAPPPVNTQTVNEPILNTSNNDINNTSNGPSLNAVNLTVSTL